jgi:hypothetical protein
VDHAVGSRLLTAQTPYSIPLHSEFVMYKVAVRRDSSVSIATRYCVDDQGIESRWGRDFPHPSRPALEPPPSLRYAGYRVIPGGKAAGARR